MKIKFLLLEVKMKNFLMGTWVLLTTISASAKEQAPLPIEHKHCFSPKGFYRYHVEKGYNYETFGIGIHYHLKRPQGINVKLSIITNPQEENVLAENESSIFYKFWITEDIAIYPIFTSKFCAHNVQKGKDMDFFIHKQTFFGGVGTEYFFSPYQSLRLELQPFRDLRNALTVHEKEKFWGKSYSNPYGGRAKIGFTHQWNEFSFVDLEVYYGKTFSNCYEERGAEVSFNWGF